MNWQELQQTTTCSVETTSLSTWWHAITVHGLLCLIGGVPLGILSYHFKGYKILSIIIAILVAGSIMAALSSSSTTTRYLFTDESSLLLLDYPHPWIGPFLASTFGFSTFFKMINAGFYSFPVGADHDLITWITWFVILPEPVFTEKGNMKRLPWLLAKQKILDRVIAVIAKVVALFLVLSLLCSSNNNNNNNKTYRIQLPSTLNQSELLITMCNGIIHIWFIYLWAALCLDASHLANSILSVKINTTNHNYSFSMVEFESGFQNPLLASRSLKEAWGVRWNRPVQQLLQRTVYVPLRKQGFGRMNAAMVTFGASGLLHEYNFSVHNAIGYQPGLATIFFVVMGALMLIEKWAWDHLLPQSVQDGINRFVPSFLISFVLTASAAIPFERYFVQSWLDAGAVECVSLMIPHITCK